MSLRVWMVLLVAHLISWPCIWCIAGLEGTHVQSLVAFTGVICWMGLMLWSSVHLSWYGKLNDTLLSYDLVNEK